MTPKQAVPWPLHRLLCNGSFGVDPEQRLLITRAIGDPMLRRAESQLDMKPDIIIIPARIVLVEMAICPVDDGPRPLRMFPRKYELIDTREEG